MTAYTPNIPALLTALPSDHTRAPQTEFTRARQVLFLENLSITGSVRSAASAACVSHQTAYRARRATPAFRTAWDAALVVARVSVADTVGCRAIDGIAEDVLYHGEVVATRTRYSDRLLLAHLARLDRLAETPAAGAFAEDFDASLAGFGRGEAFTTPEDGEPPAEVPAAAGTPTQSAPRSPARAGATGGAQTAGFSSPGPCNTRSMSTTETDGEDAAALDDGDECEAMGEDDFDDAAERAWIARNADLLAGESRRDARQPLINRLLAAMDRARPAAATTLHDRLNPDREERQMAAFCARVPEWWRVLAPQPGDGAEDWRFAPAEDADVLAA